MFGQCCKSIIPYKILHCHLILHGIQDISKQEHRYPTMVLCIRHDRHKCWKSVQDLGIQYWLPPLLSMVCHDHLLLYTKNLIQSLYLHVLPSVQREADMVLTIDPVSNNAVTSLLFKINETSLALPITAGCVC